MANWVTDICFETAYLILIRSLFHLCNLLQNQGDFKIIHLQNYFIFISIVMK